MLSLSRPFQIIEKHLHSFVDDVSLELSCGMTAMIQSAKKMFLVGFDVCVFHFGDIIVQT